MQDWLADEKDSLLSRRPRRCFTEQDRPVKSQLFNIWVLAHKVLMAEEERKEKEKRGAHKVSNGDVDENKPQTLYITPAPAHMQPLTVYVR